MNTTITVELDSLIPFNEENTTISLDSILVVGILPSGEGIVLERPQVSKGNGAPSLQSVTDAGNVTDRAVTINNNLTTSGNVIINDPVGLARFEVKDLQLNTYARLRANGTLELKANFRTLVQVSNLTANRIHYFPDENGTLEVKDKSIHLRINQVGTAIPVVSVSKSNTITVNTITKIGDGIFAVSFNGLSGEVDKYHAQFTDNRPSADLIFSKCYRFNTNTFYFRVYDAATVGAGIDGQLDGYFTLIDKGTAILPE